MAFRKKFMRKKRYTRRKRGVKRRTFKRYVKKNYKKRRFVTKRRRMAPVRRNMRAESRRQNYQRFTTLLDFGSEAISNTNDKHIEFRNFSVQDILNKEPKIADFLFIRVKKATLRWQLKGFNPVDYKLERPRTGTYMAATGDLSDGGYNNYFPNADIGLWMNSALNDTAQSDKNKDFDLENFTGNCRLAKIHGYKSGMRTFKPYILNVITSLKTNTTSQVNNNELGTATRLQKDFNGWHSIGALGDSGWCNDIRLIIPEFTAMGYEDRIYDATNTTLEKVVRLRSHPSFPAYKVQMMLEYECKGQAQSLRMVYAGPEEAKMAKATLEPAINEIQMDFEKVREDVKGSVIDQITGSHPVIAAVAAVAGLRNKRPRDEFKM
nr:MAG: capsid protein [Virus sp.]